MRLLLLLLLLATGVTAEAGGPCGSPCHCAMEKYCNASAATPAECVACEAKHKAALQQAGCVGGPGC